MLGRIPLAAAGALAGLALVAAWPAAGGASSDASCGASAYAYAGVQGSTRAFGVAATLMPVESPAVSVGHVAGWIGVGGTDAGPGGAAEWLQTGFAAFDGDQISRMYYEVTVPESQPRYVELASEVRAGETHRFAVLEMATHRSWWRVWVDHKPVTKPIYLPGSHGRWQPQAVAENWNGNRGACNAYDYRFANVRLARRAGGTWRPLRAGYVFQDAGYRVVRASSRALRSFVATSVVKPATLRQAAAASAVPVPAAPAPVDASAPAPADAAAAAAPADAAAPASPAAPADTLTP